MASSSRREDQTECQKKNSLFGTDTLAPRRSYLAPRTPKPKPEKKTSIMCTISYTSGSDTTVGLWREINRQQKRKNIKFILAKP